MKTIVLTAVILLSFAGYAQVSFTGYMVDINDKKLKDVEVNLYRGNEIISTKNWSKSFDYDLDLEKYYTLEMVKDGFIAKRIAISTFEGDKGAAPFVFVMQLIASEKGLEGLDQDYPSALIEYEKGKKLFKFDTEYAKNLKKEEKTAKKKKGN